MSKLDAFKTAAGNLGLEIRTDYSGRGMYGATCAGIVGSISDLIQFVLEVKDLEDDDDKVELLEDLPNVSKDSMGYDTIFYWQGIEGEPEDDVDDDEDDED